jgi:PAS domain S-box-containing protein
MNLPETINIEKKVEHGSVHAEVDFLRKALHESEEKYRKLVSSIDKGVQSHIFEALQAVVNGAPLKDSLSKLSQIVINDTNGEARTAFYMVDANGTCLHPIVGAGNMAEGYLQEIDGFVISEDTVACGLAIPTGRPVLAADVHCEPKWKPWMHIADKYDFRGCWSFPIKTRDAKPVGTFAMYFQSSREATPHDQALADIVTQTAAVIMANHADMQERANAEAALRHSEARLQRIINMPRVGVLTFDFSGRLLRANDSFLEMVGYSRQEFNSRQFTWQDFTPHEYLKVSEGVMEQLHTTGRGGPYEKEYLRKDGSRIWMMFVAADMGDNSIVEYAIDISEQKRAEEALRNSEARFRSEIEQVVEERTRELEHANKLMQKTNAELQRSNNYLEEFAHAASHDLKEPIRKIQVFTERLKSQLGAQLSNEQESTFGRISKSTDRMATLIDDLLVFSSVSEKPRHKELVNLNEIISQVLEDLEVDIEQKHATFSRQQLPQVMGYQRQLQQMFQNLVSNAIKYCKQDKPPHIEISSSTSNENGQSYYLIEVRDNGIGIEEEYFEKIFQMFSRLHGTNEYSGTGVGLAIVKKVVENHDGKIIVHSAVGGGSVFRTYLPV